MADEAQRGPGNNPLHGIKLEQIVTDLSAYYGWERLGQLIPIRCFQMNPSIKSSLTFLRKTPWARERVEALWIDPVILPAGERPPEPPRQTLPGNQPR